ncbi:hypothetical protein [Bacillus phage vB_BanS-Thrax3]|nr:hypothetical protein [Bacillus phage vB_BanS-Thrax3]
MTIKRFDCDVDPKVDFLEIDSTFRSAEPDGVAKLYIEITNEREDEYAIVGLNREKAQEVAEHILLELGIDVKELRSRLSDAECLLYDAQSLMSDVHCYDTETYRDISRYFNGDEDEE